MNPATLLALYDETMRKNAHPAGMTREQTPRISRYTTGTASQRYIMWHDFAATDAAATVDEELRAVQGQARVLMWKLYGHDSARDALRDALLARGFEENDHSTLMMVSATSLVESLSVTETTDSKSLDVRQLTTSKHLDAYQNIWDDVWPDAPNSRYVNDYRSLIERGETGILFYAGFATSDNPVTSGYMFHHPGDTVALLCGGTTKAAWRRQHAYKGMLAVRAHAAVERGVQYLAVEASPESKPILERLGFAPLSTLAFYEINVETL